MSRIQSPITALIDALTWLAASAEKQIEGLMQLGPQAQVADLARAFDDAVCLVTWRRRPIIPDDTLAALERIEQQLGQLEGDETAWTPTALCERQEWQRLRRAAIRALALLSDSSPTLERPARTAARS